MSALVSSQGAAFVTETGTLSALAGGAFLSETVSVGAIVDLAGDLAVSVAFAADVADVFSLVGDLAPSVALAADITVIGATLDLAGDLNAISGVRCRPDHRYRRPGLASTARARTA